VLAATAVAVAVAGVSATAACTSAADKNLGPKIVIGYSA